MIRFKKTTRQRHLNAPRRTVYDAYVGIRWIGSVSYSRTSICRAAGRWIGFGVRHSMEFGATRAQVATQLRQAAGV